MANTANNYNGWSKLPAMVQLLQMAGIGLDEPFVVLVRSDFAGDDCTPVGDHDPTKQVGLVNYQWEEGDEMWRDGKRLYYMESARFYQAGFVNGKWFTMDNAMQLLTMGGPEVEGYADPRLVATDPDYQWFVD